MQTRSSISYEGYVLYGVNERKKFSTIGIVTKDGRKRANCRISVVPDSFVRKLIEIEDVRFYNHFGFDVRAICRAIFVNIKAGKISQGGSTITQQLARSIFLSNKASIIRKIKEIFLAVWLELKYSKSEIMERYLNSIFWGKNIYGLRSASLHYFGKEVDRLSGYEEIVLLTLLRGPNYYLKQTIAFNNRLKMLNKKLFKEKFYNKKKFTKIDNSQIKLQGKVLEAFKPETIPYIAHSVDVNTFSVYTTLNKGLQHRLSQAIKKSKIHLTIVVIVDSKVRAVSSSHGSNHPFLYKTNVGSTLKPFLYTILRKNGFHRDEPIKTLSQNLYNWEVREAAKRDSRPLSLKEALLQSNNNTFVSASFQIGIAKILKELQELIPPQKLLLPSIILGATPNGISLYELALKYNIFFNSTKDQIVIECQEILAESLAQKLNLKIEGGYLKTGTTNDNKQRFAIFGAKNLTIGFLTEDYRDIGPDDYAKDTDYLLVVKSLIIDILNNF